jgi:hypothetical protein
MSREQVYISLTCAILLSILNSTSIVLLKIHKFDYEEIKEALPTQFLSHLFVGGGSRQFASLRCLSCGLA